MKSLFLRICMMAFDMFIMQYFDLRYQGNNHSYIFAYDYLKASKMA